MLATGILDSPPRIRPNVSPFADTGPLPAPRLQRWQIDDALYGQFLPRVMTPAECAAEDVRALTADEVPTRMDRHVTGLEEAREWRAAREKVAEQEALARVKERRQHLLTNNLLPNGKPKAGGYGVGAPARRLQFEQTEEAETRKVLAEREPIERAERERLERLGTEKMIQDAAAERQRYEMLERLIERAPAATEAKA